MNLIFTEQGGQPYFAQYSFENDILTVDIDGVKEVFDFTDFPDGKVEHIAIDNLPINPIVRAERVDGQLTVEVIYWYTKDEEDEYEQPLPDGIEIPIGVHNA